METITLHAHFDGEQILLDEPIELQPGTKLLVTVFSAEKAEHEEWIDCSLKQLEKAYGEDEPEYVLDRQP